MFPNIQEYFNMKSNSYRKVTEEEFIKIAIDSGKTESEAKFQLNICKTLKSGVKIGDEIIEIAE